MNMRRTLSRAAGYALMVAGAGGLIFSIVGLVVLGEVQRSIETSVVENVELVGDALAATSEGLALAESSLAQATSTIEALAGTAAGTSEAMGGTVSTLDAVAEFLGEQLPATVRTTQATLMSAATSAKLVDDALAFITNIPFLGTSQYNPEVPLHQGLEEIAASLNGLPDSLGTVHDGLVAATGDLQGVGDDLQLMAGEIEEIATSVESSQSVLVQYRDVVAGLQDLVASVQEGLPNWLLWLRLGLSLVLIWLGIAQIGLLTQGWDLIGRGREDRRGDKN
jgi:ABC-type transporter Mla subunit MlaD